MKWRHWRNRNTQLQWDGHMSKVIHNTRILFSGPIHSIHSVTENGRGYFLNLNRKQLS